MTNYTIYLIKVTNILNNLIDESGISIFATKILNGAFDRLSHRLDINKLLWKASMEKP